MLGKTNVEYFLERNLDTKIAEERDRILYEALLKEKLIETEETMVNRHGKIIHTIKGASPIYNESKELLCLVGYSLDVTRMKEAEGKLKSYAVQLEQKNEDLLHFANATSHDLKTPLRSIASYLQLLEKKNTEKLDDDSKSLIAHTVKSVKHLNQLISDIYQYSIADRHDKSVEVTDLNDIVANTIRHLEHLISEKNADIQYSKLPLLKMIPSHAGMIFSNLLSNAIKYNHSARPQVIIGCEVKEDEYIIRVADNGIGISEEYQSQIFEIFRRLHSSEEYEGTGVGLAICKRIIANYGGKIWVESESGRGAVFYFSLSKASTDPSLPGNIFSLRDYAKTA
jgi:light-regulated signal transduction histidine kinase (bacteriophytochrome)